VSPRVTQGGLGSWTLVRSTGLRDVSYVVCLGLVLSVGVLGVLLLNTSMQQQSDLITVQHQRISTLTDQIQQLRTALDRQADPALLAVAARRLHMRPVGTLRFTPVRSHLSAR